MEACRDSDVGSSREARSGTGDQQIKGMHCFSLKRPTGLMAQNDHLSFQVSALQEHILRLESRYEDTMSFNNVGLSKLVEENMTLKMQIEKLEQDTQIMQRSIHRREMMRSGQSPLKTTEPPLKERQSNLSLPSDAADFTDEHELKSLRAKYLNLKHYNQNLATKYRKERTIWKQWVDHIGAQDHDQMTPRAHLQGQSTATCSPKLTPGSLKIASDLRLSDSKVVTASDGNAPAQELSNRFSRCGSPMTMKFVDSSPVLPKDTRSRGKRDRDDGNNEAARCSEIPELEIDHNKTTVPDPSSIAEKLSKNEPEISILITSDPVTEDGQESQKRGSVISVKDEKSQNKMKDPFDLSQRSILSNDHNLEAQFERPRNAVEPMIFPYCEVVRGKAARKALHASDCPCCSKFYELAGPGVSTSSPAWKDGMTTPQSAMQGTTTRQQVGRHRARFRRSPTPPNFWDCEFPTTQQLEQERDWNRKRRTRKEIEAEENQESSKTKFVKR